MKKILEGKRIIVTGTSRGIGREMVNCFADYGADICAITRTDDPSFEKWTSVISQGRDVTIEHYSFEMRDFDSMQLTVKEITNKGKIDGLVCNAGVPHNGMLQMTSIDKMREVMEINFFAQMRLCQLVSRKMIRQKSGSIVLIGSVGGLEPRKGYIAYGSSKAALMWAGRSMAQELGAYNIRVNCVAPALTETDQMKVRSEESISTNLTEAAIKRLATPREVADTAAFLLSDMATFISGQVIRVDGGR